MNKYLISPLLLTILLQGCGGSSSSTPPEPSEPVEYNFSLTSQLSNDCGVSSAFMEIELLLQDDTWQTLKTYQPDDNGVISFITQDEFINYTIVAKNQQGDEAEGLNVVSFYQASSDTPSHYQAQFDDLVDNTTCQCVTKNLELSHRTFETQTQTSATSSLAFVESSEIDKGTTLFEGVKVCGTLDDVWPLSSFSILGTDSNGKEIGSAGFIENFNVNDDVWLVEGYEPADIFKLNLPYQEVSSVQLIDGEKHFPMQVAEGEQSLLIFDNHINTFKSDYQSQASVTWVLKNNDRESVISKNIRRVTSTDAQTSIDVKASMHKPAFDEDFQEINGDYSYDYSAVAGFPMAVISYTFLAFDSESKILPAKWTFYGPEKGMLAISAPLTGYEEIINAKTRKDAIDVRLVNSLSSNNYHDYIKYYQGNSSANMTSDFAKEMTAVELARKYY
ncbi:hypothetical protein CMT41_04630 [Colwellia sp. MT41]|uniref:hypothetical protein n=1 Tax=Colwellia sp. MT41 TaxID=58049 RepID=UPI000717A81D|nr:hypothetical protein [Colwellia sp. MT41]ALO34091.1 hypothetical protein CMT41_04630 [Colwellia sp. MT41]